MTPDPLNTAIEAIAQRDGDDLTDFMALLALETGGYFKPPQAGNSWDSQLWELSAHGIFATGATARELARNWGKAASIERDARADFARALADLHGPIDPDTAALTGPYHRLRA